MSRSQLDASIQGFVAHLICPICLCTFVNPYSMPCNHCFCHECIIRSLKVSGACPICKAPCKKRSLREDVMIRDIVAGYRQYSGFDSHCDAQHKEFKWKETDEKALVTPIRTKKAKKAPFLKDWETRDVHVDNSVVRQGVLCATFMDRTSQSTICTDITTLESSIGDTNELNDFSFERQDEPEQQPSPATVDADLSSSSLPNHTLQNDQHQSSIESLASGASKARENKSHEEKLDTAAREEYAPIHDGKRRAQIVGSLAIDLKNDEIMYDTTPEKVSKPLLCEKAQTPSRQASKLVRQSRRSLRRPRQPFPQTIILCSGFTPERLNTVQKWADQIGAEIKSTWCTSVTHLIVQCVNVRPKSCIQEGMNQSTRTCITQRRRYVKKRSLKYLKALAAGRWIVSEEWLQACSKLGRHIDEVDYEVYGYLKAKHAESPVLICRLRREVYMKQASVIEDPNVIGSKLFSSFCHFFTGDFRPPLPPLSEIDSLLQIGGSHRIQSLESIGGIDATEGRKLLIVCDNANPRSFCEAASTQKSLKVQHRIDSVLVSYLWIFDSVTYGTLQPIPSYRI